MHSLTYVMKQSRPNKRKSASQRQKQQQPSSALNSGRKNNTQAVIETPSNSNVRMGKPKRKFQEQSIFLPYIDKNVNKYKKMSERQYIYHPPRLHTYGDELKQVMEESEGETMQYLYQCDQIILNLKRLNNIQSNKMRRKVPFSTNDHYKDYTLNKSRLRHHSQYQNQFQQPFSSEAMKMKFKQIENKRTLTQGVRSINDRSKNNDVSAKEEISPALVKKRQKYFIKFLNVAKDRGLQLKKKINQHRQKNSLSAKKHESGGQNSQQNRKTDIQKQRQSKQQKKSTRESQSQKFTKQQHLIKNK